MTNCCRYKFYSTKLFVYLGKHCFLALHLRQLYRPIGLSSTSLRVIFLSEALVSVLRRSRGVSRRACTCRGRGDRESKEVRRRTRCGGRCCSGDGEEAQQGAPAPSAPSSWRLPIRGATSRGTRYQPGEEECYKIESGNTHHIPYEKNRRAIFNQAIGIHIIFLRRRRRRAVLLLT